jgi:hypothetical protein
MGFYSSAEVQPPTAPRPEWQVGQVETFTYYNNDTGERRRVRAVLRYVTPHVYMLFEEGLEVDDEAIATAAETFEDEVYPLIRRVFGEEWSPGIDADPHLLILHLAELEGGSWGEFGLGDECPPVMCELSNGHEMFYVSLHELEVGSDDYLSTLAHEFQHMIQFNMDPSESRWLDEGLAQIAEVIAGYPASDSAVWAFFDDTDLQLDHWLGPETDDYPNYGAAYLFLRYLYERFGESFIHDLSRHPLNSLASVEAVLRAQAPPMSLDQVFGEWAVANWLDDPALADGQFGYPAVDLPVIMEAQVGSSRTIGGLTWHSTYPVDAAATLHPYAADYIYLQGAGDLRLTFDGAAETALAPTTSHSGKWFWWSNREDSSIASLQRTLDLTNLQNPRATFWTWYDLEQEIDVVLIEVSSDGGQSWRIVPGRDSWRDDWWEYAFTGTSGPGRLASWVQEEVDLERWEGQSIILRLQYITDSYYVRPGFIMDDFELVGEDASGARVVALSQDFEAGPAGWEATGFAYAQERVTTKWAVYLIEHGERTLVRPVSLNAEHHGEIEVRLAGEVTSAVLVVAAMVPYTNEVAHYAYQIAAGE